MSADRRTIANALRLAQGCIADAALLAGAGSRNAAYLCEQALEQVIRALATSEKIHIERHDAHQLDKIVRRFPDDHSEKTTLRSLTWLEAYATTFRYTSPLGHVPKAPDESKLETAIQDTDSLISRAAEHFGVDLNSDQLPSRTETPMRRKG